MFGPPSIPFPFRSRRHHSLSAGLSMPNARARGAKSADSGVRIIRSASASVRLQEARRFLDTFSPGTEVLLLGASRGAVDDLARTIAMEKGATFGLHRLSFTQLAARLAAPELAARGQAPASALGVRSRSRRGRRLKPRTRTRSNTSRRYRTPRFSQGSRSHVARVEIGGRGRRATGRTVTQRAGSRRSARPRGNADERGRCQRPCVTVRHGHERLEVGGRPDGRRCPCCCSTCHSSPMPRRGFSGRSLNDPREPWSRFQRVTHARSRSFRNSGVSFESLEPRRQHRSGAALASSVFSRAAHRSASAAVS